MIRSLTARSVALIGAVLAALLASSTPSQAQEYFDDMNGVWTVKLAGQDQTATALTEAYTPGGAEVTLRFKDVAIKCTKTGTSLTGKLTSDGLAGHLPGNTPTGAEAEVKLEVKGLETKSPADDSLEGTYLGKAAVFKRDLRSKPPIVVKLPGDRPWVRFMREVLIPKTAEDRETYHLFKTAPARTFLRSCQLHVSDYWMRKYMKGGGTPEGRKSFDNIITGMEGQLVSPRTITTSRFASVLRSNLAPAAMDSYALARSGLGMYFGTAAGGAVRIPVTDNGDSMIWYITDRRASSKNGLVVMLTPTHPPLASSFGKWLLDFSQMDGKDDLAFGRCLLETMVKSSCKAANSLESGHGKSAFTDYLGVMAIEDQRGVMFDNDSLSWGYNMTSGSFTALICRALSHGKTRPGPDLVALLGDSAKNRRLAQQMGLDGRPELATKVIVEDWSGDGPELRPGDCSYFDTLNGADDVLEGAGTRGGDDFQERGGMGTLRTLTTKWLRAKHPALVTAAEQSVSMFIPADEVSSRAKEDVFHLLCENFFDAARFAKVTPAQGEKIIKAGLALLEKVKAESKDLEKFILESGVKASDEWAPRASGF